MEKQGYTHQLLVPNAVRLEAARAHIEAVARRLDTDEEDLQVEGSIAKYFATEAGDAMANDAIQAFGGYGYIREYEVEKIKRDVKILTIYEGTSEIQRNIIAMFRLRSTVRSKGGFYNETADELARLPSETGAPMLAEAVRLMNEVIQSARKGKLTKNQYVMFQLADMMTWAEVATALCRKAGNEGGPVFMKVAARTPAFMKAASRLFAREAIHKIRANGLLISQGCGNRLNDAAAKLNALNTEQILAGSLSDMDIVAKELAV